MMRVFTFIFAFFAVLATGAENLNTWQKQMPITFSGYTPPGGGTLTNFPALVIFSNTTVGAGFAYSNFLSPPYADLRFTAGDKTTPLNFEVEKWDTNGNSYVWVQVPALVDTNTRIWAFWGMDSVSAPSCTTNGTTWDANYRGVWHLAQTNALDSTTNRHSGTSRGNTNALGLIGTAQGFSGINSYLDLGTTPLLPSTAPWTISGWMNPTSLGVDVDIFAQYIGVYSNGRLLLRINPNTDFDLFLGDDALHAAVPVVVGKVSTNTWFYFSFSRNGSNFVGYLNGVKAATSNDADANRAILQAGNLLGARGINATTYNLNPGAFFPGFLDEFRVSSITRSSDWIWTCYMNTASNDVFNTYGAPALVGVSGTIIYSW